MSVLTDALNLLKRELESINSSKTLSRNRSGLNNTSEAAQLFVNPDLLNLLDFKPGESDGYINPTSTTYPDKVIQAVWNIADISSGATGILGVASVLTQASALTENFAYLDQTWVPRIVDQKTYKVGKALIKFLDKAITDSASLNLVPTQNMKENVRSTLQSMQNILEKRMRFYEIHSPDNVAKVRDLIKVKKERRDALAVQLENFTTKYWEVDKIISESSKVINSPLKSSDGASLENKISLYEESKKALLKEKDSAFKSIGEWNEDNKKNKYPDELFASDFILSLSYSDPLSHKKMWQNLFNGPDQQLHKEGVAHSLNETYERNRSHISRVDEELLPMLENNIVLLKNRIIAAKALAEFEQKLDVSMASFPDVDEPEFLAKKDKIVVVLSDEMKIEDKLTADIQSYTSYIEQLNDYQIVLQKHKKSLLAYESEFSQNNPLPEEVVESPYIQAFEKAIDDSKDKIIQRANKVDGQMANVAELISQAHLSIKELQDELAKQSSAGRQKKLDNLQEVIDKEKISMDKLVQKIAEKEVSLAQYRQDTYEPAIAAINTKYADDIKIVTEQLTKAEEQVVKESPKLEEIKQKFNARKEFLTTAHADLSKYKEVLLASKSIYIPSGQIPKEQLKAYLEVGANTPQEQFINDVYSVEKAGTGWYGLNITNMTNYFTHYATIISESEFDYDLNDIIEQIDNKIKQINKELTINIDAKEGAIVIPVNIAENNLYKLNDGYQNFVKSIEDRDTLSKIKLQKLDKKVNDIEVVESALKSQEQDLEHLQFNLKINESALAQAQLNHNCSSFEFKLIEFNESQKKFSNDIDTILNEVNSDIALDKLANVLKLNEQFQSLCDLSDTIDTAIVLNEGALAKFEESDLSLMTKGLLDKKEALSIEHNELKAQKALLTTELKRLELSVNTNYTTITRMKELLDTEKDVEGLKERRANLTEKDTALRDVLVDDINRLAEKQAVILDREINKSEIPAMQNRASLIKTNLISLIDFTKEVNLIKNGLSDHQTSFKETLKRIPHLPFERDKTSLKVEYFGKSSSKEIEGIMGDYLKERNKTFWFRDMLSQVAALALGCFGYKTSAQERQEYLADKLLPAIEVYEKDPKSNIEMLNKIISEGKKQFSPRANNLQQGYDNSLLAKLTKLETRINDLELKHANQKIEKEVSESNLKPS